MNRTMTINKGWKFHPGEIENGFYKGLDDSAWQDVTLPHDWSVSQPFSKDCSSGTGYLPGGVGWYRRRFKLPGEAKGKKVRVTFDGVYQHARVWINGNYLGMRAYGYSTFSHDITEFLVPGDNVLAVRAEHIHLADSRWFTGAGIYRDVHFTFMDPLHFVEDGVFVSTRGAADGRAELSVSWELSAPGKVQFSLVAIDGSTAASMSGSGRKGEVAATVMDPRLWSPESPCLYTLVAQALEDDAVRDEIRVETGIRTFRFDPDEGFFLNGVNMKLKGVCVHHDAGALGAAVPENVWKRRLQKLKGAGCNALRTSHNPPDPKLLTLCDRMGFLVMDEAFDEWEGCKNKWWQGHNVYPPKLYGYSDDFPQWHRIDLSAMVRRDRNHPCVFLWSIGNEIDYPNDPYVHPSFESMTGNNDANKPAAERLYDANKPDARRLATIAGELAAIVREQDSTRPVTAALAFPELSNLTGFARALDVVGYNYKEQLYDDDHRRYPGMVIYGSENSTRADAWLPVKHLPYICGQFLWTGIDYLGEARGWPIRVSPAGLLDTAGFEKPLWALRRALWSQDKSVRLAVSENGEIHHECFGWFGGSGDEKHVTCYTNACRAELFINGRSLGSVPVGENCTARWTLPYEEGILRAEASWPDGTRAEDALMTAGREPRLRLALAENDTVMADGSVAQVEASLLDERGNLVCDLDEPVMFEAVNGEIIGIENGDIADLTPYASLTRKTRHGRMIVYVRAGSLPGEMLLSAARTGVTVKIVIPVKAE